MVGSRYQATTKEDELRRLSSCCNDLTIAVQLLVVTMCKYSINPVTNPHPISSHLTRDNVVSEVTKYVTI
jgi:hypothetical protein